MRSIIIQLFLLFFIFLISTACTSDEIQQPDYGKIELEKIDKVLILGNSITITVPNPDLGWFGDWGMAASSREKDYVHLLMAEFKNQKSTIEVKYFSISNFEREFWKLDLSAFDAFKSYQPDLLIVNIGENVDEDNARNHAFDEHLSRLISFLAESSTTEIVCVDSFWPKKIVNDQIREICHEQDFRFVSIADLSGTSSNTAKGSFEHTGVAAHPSDQGMQIIAERVYHALGLE